MTTVHEIAKSILANPRPDAGDGDPLIRYMDIEDAVIEAFDLDPIEDAHRIEDLTARVDEVIYG